MEKRFFLVARKHPFDRDFEVFAPVCVKSKWESGTFLNIIFFYNLPNCRRKAEGLRASLFLF